jgi:hypothetical protein
LLVLIVVLDREDDDEDEDKAGQLARAVRAPYEPRRY